MNFRPLNHLIAEKTDEDGVPYMVICCALCHHWWLLQGSLMEAKADLDDHVQIQHQAPLEADRADQTVPTA